MANVNLDNVLSAGIGIIDKNLKCIICQKLVNDAVLSTVCGCQYCYKCINHYIGTENKYCPGDQEECKDEFLVLDRNAVRNSKLNKTISKLRIKCPNQWCLSDIDLLKLEEHLRVCTSEQINCPYASIGCDSENVVRQTIETHLHIDAFSHSELLIELIQNLKNEVNVLKKHYDESKLEIIALKVETSTNKAEISMLEQELRKVNHEIDSRVTEEIEKVKKEMNNDRRSQIELAVSEKRNIDSIMYYLKDNMDTSKLELISLKEELSALEAGVIAPIERELTKIKENVNEIRRQIEDIKIEGINEDGEEKCDEERERRFNKWIKWNNLCPNIDADFVWRISHCSQKINKELWSDSFYAFDYKFCLYMNIGSSDNIWLYCHIMKGDNDDKLRWPMRLAVTLSIVDQVTLRPHKSEMYQYDTYSQKKAFDRPNKETNKYRIGGHPSPFISYSSIKNSSSIIVNDCIIVSCNVYNL